MSDKPSFFSELKRRNVVRMAGLYLVGAWLLTQVASTVLPMFGAPDWLPRSLVMLLAIGFIPALIFSTIPLLSKKRSALHRVAVREIEGSPLTRAGVRLILLREIV